MPTEYPGFLRDTCRDREQGPYGRGSIGDVMAKVAAGIQAWAELEREAKKIIKANDAISTKPEESPHVIFHSPPPFVTSTRSVSVSRDLF